MTIDYVEFGDVVIFNITYSTNSVYKPFVIFVKFNHFKWAVISRVTLLYDETIKSLKLLFESFLKAYKKKKH